MSDGIDITKRHHVVMVPGFGGFDALGSLKYYSGVTPILTSPYGVSLHERSPLKTPYPIDVHYFPNFPTASIVTRAKWLGEWLAKRVERGLFKPEDSLHLIGHSTGGLDIRLLVYNLHYFDEIFESKLTCENAQLLKQMLCSVQCLSTPHRGTNLASKLEFFHPFLAGVAKCLYWKFKAIPSSWSTFFAGQIRSIPLLWRRADFCMALWDSLARNHRSSPPFESAKARKRYFTMLDWIANLGFDSRAVEDLHPEGPAPFGFSETTPARWNEHKLALENKIYNGALGKVVRRRSLVTVGKRPAKMQCRAYTALYKMISCDPPPSLGEELPVDSLIAKDDTKKEKETLTLGRSLNDGIVNSASMVWPTGDDYRDNNRFLHADHGDIIGHFHEDASVPKYDLLLSDSGFNEKTFEKTWRNIRDYVHGSIL